jgi:anti-sigma B factor antagonist
MLDSRLDIPGQRIGDGDDSPALQVAVTDVAAGVALVEVRGDLDLMTAPVFDAWVRERLAGRADVVLDLDRVTFLASAGIAVLMGLQREAGRLGVRLHLTGSRNPAVRRPLQVLGLEPVLNLRADVATVVAELAPTATGPAG